MSNVYTGASRCARALSCSPSSCAVVDPVAVSQGVQLEVQASGAELMQLAHSRSGPLQDAGWPEQVTIGQAHHFSNALSQGVVSSSLPQPGSTATTQASNARQRKDFLSMAAG